MDPASRSLLVLTTCEAIHHNLRDGAPSWNPLYLDSNATGLEEIFFMALDTNRVRFYAHVSHWDPVAGTERLFKPVIDYVEDLLEPIHFPPDFQRLLHHMGTDSRHLNSVLHCEAHSIDFDSLMDAEMPEKVFTLEGELAAQTTLQKAIACLASDVTSSSNAHRAHPNWDRDIMQALYTCEVYAEPRTMVSSSLPAIDECEGGVCKLSPQEAALLEFDDPGAGI